MKFRRAPRDDKEARPATLLGNILIAMRACTEKEIASTLSRMEDNEDDRRLGEALIAAGKIQASDLEKALSLQKRMRYGDRLGALMEIAAIQTEIRARRMRAATAGS